MFIGICSRSQVSIYRTIGPLVQEGLIFKLIYLYLYSIKYFLRYRHSPKTFRTTLVRPFQDYFSLYETGQSVVRQKWENPGKKHLTHLQAKLGLSHMWPEQGYLFIYLFYFFYFYFFIFIPHHLKSAGYYVIPSKKNLRSSVRPSVRPSVRLSVLPSVRPSAFCFRALS